MFWRNYSVEQQPEYHRHRTLRFLQDYYQAVLAVNQFPDGEWAQMYRERLNEIQEELNGLDNHSQ